MTQDRITYWDPNAFSWGQHLFALAGTLAIGLGWLVYFTRPEGRYRKARATEPLTVARPASKPAPLRLV